MDDRAGAREDRHRQCRTLPANCDDLRFSTSNRSSTAESCCPCRQQPVEQAGGRGLILGDPLAASRRAGRPTAMRYLRTVRSKGSAEDEVRLERWGGGDAHLSTAAALALGGMPAGRVRGMAWYRPARRRVLVDAEVGAAQRQEGPSRSGHYRSAARPARQRHGPAPPIAKIQLHRIERKFDTAEAVRPTGAARDNQPAAQYTRSAMPAGRGDGADVRGVADPFRPSRKKGFGG